LILKGLGVGTGGTPVAMSVSMLRITNHQQGDTVVLRLEGWLRGAWVDELRQCWRRVREERGDRAIRIDLVDVRVVDAAGKALLSEMHRAGARIFAHGPLTTAIRDAIVSDSGDENPVTS